MATWIIISWRMLAKVSGNPSKTGNNTSQKTEGIIAAELKSQESACHSIQQHPAITKSGI